MQRFSLMEERRQALQHQINLSRRAELRNLHAKSEGHVVDSIFTFISLNMSLVSWIVAGIYWNSSCQAPLQSFLFLNGFLVPFLSCLPILLRQWYYLQLRFNCTSAAIFGLSFISIIWFIIGQQWAFRSSAKTCDPDLALATNIIVFVMFIAIMLYASKIVWYLLFRVRYSYKQLFRSCFHDPYPNTKVMSEQELLQLEQQYQDAILDAQLEKEESEYDHRHRSGAIELRVAEYEHLFEPTEASKQRRSPQKSKDFSTLDV